MDLLLLCGGLATRLGSATATRPKVLMEVAGRPFLDYLLDAYRPHFERIFLLAGHHGSQLLSNESPQVRVVVEPERLDTGGAVLHVLDDVADRFCVVNGDTYFERLDIPRLVDSAAAAGALIAICRGDCASGGCVELDGKTVRGFHEKSRTGEGYLYTGFGIFTKKALAPFERGPVSLERVILPELARRGQLLAQEVDVEMFDIGTPERLERFRRHIAGGRP